MADTPQPPPLVAATYIGGDMLTTPDGSEILPGDRLDVSAEIVDQPGSPWVSKAPPGSLDRLKLYTANIIAAATGGQLTADPLAGPADSEGE